MSSLPYRSSDPSSVEDTHADEGDRGMLLVLALFWLLSVARVVGGVLRHETFGGEPTLALMAVIAVPWLISGRATHRS
ncbi:MAG: hypothetical protein M3O46_01970 [Myxococcota bacterium]|nr:hypothetical protein [Myxococcota bacterium]